MSVDATGGRANAAPVEPFEWRDFSRFVRVSRVATGWLVLWGTYFDLGTRTELSGSRLYAARAGVVERVGAAASEVTGRAALAEEAMVRCRHWFADQAA